MGRKTKRLDPKPCEACGAPSERLLRCRVGPEDAPWRLLCEPCWVKEAKDAPGYTYGGEWRVRKRR